MKKRRHKKYNKHKHAMMLLRGMTMSWRVVDPLEPDADVHDFSQVGHKNKTLEYLRPEILAMFIKIKDRQRLRYRIDVNCHFKDDFGKEYIRGRQMLVEGVISQADEAYFQTVESIFDESNMNHYQITEVQIEVLGQGQLNKADFKESA